MYSLVSLLSNIYPLPAMHSLLVTSYVMEYLIGIKRATSPSKVNKKTAFREKISKTRPGGPLGSILMVDGPFFLG